MICPSCGHENRDGAKFCEECATLLGAAPSHPVAEERKVVTALFCDLVGFTAASESADPEDVAKMLADYFSIARAQIEAHGGIVEKFIGDAVVGVFGVPAAHEDDPERAVRAGLRITEAAEDLTAIGRSLRLRVGINTGDALVRLGITPGSGEGFLAGDAINTASRIQSIAPEMGVAVGIGTFEATEPVFDYEELQSAVLKGKARPVRVFWAKSSRSRFGADLTRTPDSPFVGREIDLALLKGIFEKTRASNSVQLVTVVGEPGLGKSRLVAELFGCMNEIPDLIRWRQGRCLPYGEGITFWALGEILKAHAGILESDPPHAAIAKLEDVLPEGPERGWFRQRLLPLLGIEATSSAEREELFTAWRRFLERIAEQDPTVLVFEDLHWADPAMLAFLEHLADRAEEVPLLIVGTARPELHERHPDFANGLLNTNTILLSPLTEGETTRLVSALLETSVIPVALQVPVLERSGGNPLYAEEFVRMLKDRGLVARKGMSWELTEGAEIPFPDSIQALIAARLDTLSTGRKAMLADAAVIGKVFWAGAVAAMGNLTEAEVTEAMHELSRKELVRPARRSSMEGEAEYAFWHVLARDVAYAQLPRASRASRHVAAARWIESKAPERLEDLAEVLAYHYSSALELSRAAGQDEQVRELEAPTLRFLILAGDRALGLDTAAALAAFERALELTPPGHPARAELLARFGDAANQSGHFTDAAAALEEAIATFREEGDALAAARAISSIATVYLRLNDPRSYEVRSEALAQLEPLPPGPELIDALAGVSNRATAFGRPAEGLALAERALDVGARLGLERDARALECRAMARCALGDPGGLTDYREALRSSIDANQLFKAGSLYNNLAVSLHAYEGPRAALQTYEEGIRFSESRGLRAWASHMTTGSLDSLFAAGEIDGALAGAVSQSSRAQAGGDAFNLIFIRLIQVLASTYQGRAHDTRELWGSIESSARELGRVDTIALLGAVAIACAASGDAKWAAQLLEEAERTPNIGSDAEYPKYLPAMARTAIEIGEPELAERLASHLTRRFPNAEHALAAVQAALAESCGETQAAADAYADAASRWESFGAVPEQGFALLGQGRCLLELSRPGESTEALQQAREIFMGCGMSPAIEETDALLAKATPLIS